MLYNDIFTLMVIACKRQYVRYTNVIRHAGAYGIAMTKTLHLIKSDKRTCRDTC